MKNIPCWPDKALRDVFLLFLIKILQKSMQKSEKYGKISDMCGGVFVFYSTEY